jgi:release factor glutamine methyltransferase
MTWFEFYQKTGSILTESFIDSPKLEAELLICHRHQLSRAKFIQILNDPLPAGFDNSLDDLIKRRLSGESLHSITGSRYFDQFEFIVNQHVLIPRPETEMIVESVQKKADSRAPVKILDIGTGSGILPVVLTYYLENARIDALDISPEALSVAEKNIRKFPHTADRIRLIQSDIKDYIPDGLYDLIVSNPPYIPEAEAQDLIASRKLGDPLIALTPGKTGLEMFEIIRSFTDRYLKAGGLAVMEHGAGQREEVKRIFSGYQITVLDDPAGIDRLILAEKTE